MSNNKRRAQWETGEIDAYVDEFMAKLKPDQSQLPISHRSLSTESPNKNMNRTNPFKENGETIKQTGDDQVQLQQTFNDMGGYLPVMARRRRLRMALFDEQSYPAGDDVPQMGDVTEVNQMDPYDKEMQPKRKWQSLTDRNQSQKLYLRDGNKPIDQILPGIVDPTREVGDGEQI